MTLQVVSPSEQNVIEEFAHASATTSKVPIALNTRTFIPMNTADAAASNAFLVKGTIDGATTDTGTAWAIGDLVYWDATNSRFTKTSTSNTKAGYALEAKASGDAVSGRILFDAFAQ